MLSAGIVILLIGIPGSGKSYYIKQYKLSHPTTKIAVCSADHFFEKSGEYRFNPKLLGQAHDECFEKFYASLSSNIPVIFVDNTNIIAAHRDRYIKTAYQFHYSVELIVFKPDVELSFSRNVHNVPKEALLRMSNQMDITPGKYSVKFNNDNSYSILPLKTEISESLIKHILYGNI